MWKEFKELMHALFAPSHVLMREFNNRQLEMSAELNKNAYEAMRKIAERERIKADRQKLYVR